MRPSLPRAGIIPGPAFPSPHETAQFEWIEPRDAYLKRLGELVRFDTIRGTTGQPGPRIVFDALHGCGAGYLDRVLADHGITVQTLRTERDVMFDGTGPDVSENNLAPLSKAGKGDGRDDWSCHRRRRRPLRHRGRRRQVVFAQSHSGAAVRLPDRVARLATGRGAQRGHFAPDRRRGREERPGRA